MTGARIEDSENWAITAEFDVGVLSRVSVVVDSRPEVVSLAGIEYSLLDEESTISSESRETPEEVVEGKRKADAEDSLAKRLVDGL